MVYSDNYINKLITDEINFCDNVSLKYDYPDNISHLLYVIIPAFILKYGINYKSLVEQCFFNTQIIIDDQHDQISQAYYFGIPNYQNGRIVVDKRIVLKNYKDISLIQLIDNLVHEFNHAINSIQNDVITDNYVLVRTGIVYNYFDNKTLKFIKKGVENVLEEVINTKQTEEIVDIIKSFSNYQINNMTVSNTLYSIHHMTDSNYHSNSYLFESLVCRKLLENKTFLSTFETLRFEGRVNDIHNFFDDIVGKKNSLFELSLLLNKSLELQKSVNNKKWFKKKVINKIKNINIKAVEIVERFNSNTVYK